MNASSAFPIVTYRSDLKEGGKTGLFSFEDLSDQGVTTFDIPINFAFIRLRIAATIGNAIQATITLKRNSFTPNIEGDNDYIGTPQSAVTSNILTRTALGLSFLDCSGFNSAMVQIKSTGTGGTFRFTASNYEADFNPIPVYNQITGQLIDSPITASLSNISYKFPIEFKYYRLEIVTPITGGVIQAFTRLSTKSFLLGNSIIDIEPRALSLWQSRAVIPNSANFVTLQVAPPAGLKNYVTSLQVVGTNTTLAGGSIALVSGGITIWEGALPVGAASTPIVITVKFDVPISGAVASTITCAVVTLNTVTAIVTAGRLVVNAQGYISS
jgi:hypothetical protein